MSFGRLGLLGRGFGRLGGGRGAVGGGAPPASFTFENAGIAVQTTNGTTSTFTAKPIGTAVAGRKLLIFAAGNTAGGSPGLSGLTVDGNAATLIGSTFLSLNYSIGAFVFPLDAGTTANIIASWNGITVGRAACAVFAMYDSGAAEADSDGSVSTGTAVSHTLTVPAGGAGFMMEIHDAVTEPSVWSGTDTVEATASTSVEGSVFVSTGTNSVAGSKTLTATWGTTRAFAAAAVTWGPP